MLQNRKNMALLSFAVFFVAFDRFLKIFSINYVNAPLSIFGNWLKFHFVPNQYISFSIPISGQYLIFFIIILILAIVGIIFYLILEKKEVGVEVYGLTIILFGAISNLLDRIKYGFVIDYFDFRYFTVFNLADVMITAGILIILLNIILKQKK